MGICSPFAKGCSKATSTEVRTPRNESVVGGANLLLIVRSQHRGHFYESLHYPPADTDNEYCLHCQHNRIFAGTPDSRRSSHNNGGH